jgi:hypothetical protein
MIPLKKISGQEKRFRFHLCTPEEVAARTILAAKRSLPKCRIVGNKKISKVTKKKAKKPSIIDVQQQKHASIKATGSEKPITPEPLPVVEVPATTEEDKNNSTAV